MAFSLSFSPEFYGDCYNAQPSDRPTTVADALASMSDEQWESMAQDVFGCSGEYLGIEDVMAEIEETDTCSDLSSPVSVWIDDDGYFTVDVYDERDDD